MESDNKQVLDKITFGNGLTIHKLNLEKLNSVMGSKYPTIEEMEYLKVQKTQLLQKELRKLKNDNGPQKQDYKDSIDEVGTSVTFIEHWMNEILDIAEK